MQRKACRWANDSMNMIGERREVRCAAVSPTRAFQKYSLSELMATFIQ